MSNEKQDRNANHNHEKEHGSQENSIINDDAKIDSSVHLTTKKRVIFWLYLFSILIYAIIMTLLIGLSWQPMRDFKNTDNFYYANQVTYQWKLGFIIDMVITGDLDCPSGYQHAFRYQWGGTNYGCFCQPMPSISFVLSGYCTPSLIQQNCRNIQRREAFETNYWRNNSNFCVKRSSTSFANEEKYTGNNDQKVCGSSNSLTILPSSSPCPFISLSPSPSPLQENQHPIPDVDSAFSNHQTLHAIYNGTSPYSFYLYPISEFVVSEYEFCLIGEDTGINPDHEDFILLMKDRGCAQKGNFTVVDEITQEEFYAANEKLEQLEDLEGFPPPNFWTYKLGYSAIPSWKYQCRHNMDQKFKITTSSDQFNFTFFSTFESLAITLIVFLAVLFAQFLILLLRRIYRTQIFPVGYKQLHLPYDFAQSLIRYIVDLLCKLTILSLFLYITYTTIYNWNWFKSAINQNCAESSPQIQEYILGPYERMYVEVIMYAVGGVIVGIGFLVADVIHFYYVYHGELKFYLVSSEGRNLVANQNGEKGNNQGDLGDHNLDLDFLKQDMNHNKWMRIGDKGSERDRRDVLDDFRVTMAMNLAPNLNSNISGNANNNNNNNNNNSIMFEEQDILKKPKIKKKKKPMRGLFQKMQEKQEEGNNQGQRERERDKKKKEDLDTFMMREGDPYILENEGMMNDESLQKIDLGEKKERRRR